jgi:hypothetical protein
VADLAGEGYPWQASVAIWPEEVEEIRAGETVTVNNLAFRGPGIVVRKGQLREISFVSLGLDANTAVVPLAASAGGGGLPANESPADFQTSVKEMMRSRGLPVRLAIKAAATAWPGLWRAYLDQTQDPEGVKAFCGLADPPADPFLAKMKSYMDAGKSRIEALKAAVQNFPDLHQAYIDRANQETP